VVLLLLLLQKLLLALGSFLPKEKMLLLEVHQRQVRELVHQQQAPMLKAQHTEVERQTQHPEQQGLILPL
jgi:hypothetical protein